MKTKNKIGCFIICRASSSRLPGKILKTIAGKPMIQHIIERAKLMFPSGIVVLCTSVEKNDNVLEDIAKANKIKTHRGSLKDILARLMGAAEKFGVNYFAIYSGDNIFCDPELVNLGMSQMIKNKLDFLTIPDSLVCGGAAYCVSTRALKRVCQDKTTDNTEYYPKFFTSRKDFKIGVLAVDDPIFHNSNIRLTTDYPEDLEFVRTVFNELGTDKNNIPLKKILKLINKKPEIAKINYFRQKDWSANQKPMKIID